MSIKNIILSLPYLLVALFIYSQTNNTENINSASHQVSAQDEIVIKVESPLLVFLESETPKAPPEASLAKGVRRSDNFLGLPTANIDEPLIISGSSNLSKDTIIRINISGKITSLDRGRFELINTFRVVVGNDGNWCQQISPIREMPFLAEFFKIEISVDDDSLMFLEEKGFSGETLQQKYCYYLDVISPVFCEWREQDISFLYQTIIGLYDLNNRLKKFIADNPPQNYWDSATVSQMGKDAKEDAIKKWQEFENNYIKELDLLSERYQLGEYTLRTLSGSQGENPEWVGLPLQSNEVRIPENLLLHEKVSALITSLYDECLKYQLRFIKPLMQKGLIPKNTSYYPLDSSLSKSNPDENNLFIIIEKEISSMIFQDILATIEFIYKNYNADSGVDVGKRLKINNESERFCRKLKSELERYYQIGLFNRPPDKHFLKQSSDLMDIIDTVLLLIGKFNIYLQFQTSSDSAPPEASLAKSGETRQEGQEEIQNLLKVINNKVSALSAILY